MAKFLQILSAIQQDLGNRGLARDPHNNLFQYAAADLRAACKSIAYHPKPILGIVTGFYIPHAQPPCAETDGPLGAVFLARTLVKMGISVSLWTDPFALHALQVGCPEATCYLIPENGQIDPAIQPTHWLALERVGPSHTPTSIQQNSLHSPHAAAIQERHQKTVPVSSHGRYHTMRGIDITDQLRPAHLLFENRTQSTPVTIGIGDGGNEIGMGKIPWSLIADQIPRGETIACRTPVDFLIMAGISNWGAYALSAGIALLRKEVNPARWFDTIEEEMVLRRMVEQGPLVDGVTGLATATVDGLPLEQYLEPFRKIRQILETPL